MDEFVCEESPPPVGNLLVIEIRYSSLPPSFGIVCEKRLLQRFFHFLDNVMKIRKSIRVTTSSKADPQLPPPAIEEEELIEAALADSPTHSCSTSRIRQSCPCQLTGTFHSQTELFALCHRMKKN
ncbi:hypothetical protein ACLOJK_041899 [Asimina triloba]